MNWLINEVRRSRGVGGIHLRNLPNKLTIVEDKKSIV